MSCDNVSMKKLIALAPLVLAGLIAGCGSTTTSTQKLPYVTPPPVVKATPTPASTGPTLNMAAAKASLMAAALTLYNAAQTESAEVKTWNAATPLATQQATLAALNTAFVNYYSAIQALEPEVNAQTRLDIEKYLGTIQPILGYTQKFEHDTSAQIEAGMPGYFAAIAATDKAAEPMVQDFQGY